MRIFQVLENTYILIINNIHILLECGWNTRYDPA
jgi:hypothetical protein